MRKNLKFLALGMTLVAMVTLFMASYPVKAEEDAGEHTTVTDMRGVNRYHWFYYPTSKTYFALPKDYETRFDIHNGYFAEVYYKENYAHGELDQFRSKSGDLDQVHMKVDMWFYTPRGELIGGYRRIQPGIAYNIPTTKRSFEYDRLQVKLENHTTALRELRLLVIDGSGDNIKGTPIPGVFRNP